MNKEIRTFASSHIGRIREENQDRYCFMDYTNWENKSKFFLAIADGMGGLDFGGMAAELAINSVIDYLSNEKLDISKSESILVKLKEASYFANQKVFNKSKELGASMGTTLTFAVLIEDTFYFCHIGDTRVYVFSGENLFSKPAHNLIQLTKDDNLVGRTNILTKYIGAPIPFNPQILVRRKKRGEVLIFSSDGLHNNITSLLLAKVIKETKLQEVPDKLINHANESGGEDNISVLISEVL